MKECEGYYVFKPSNCVSKFKMPVMNKNFVARKSTSYDLVLHPRHRSFAIQKPTRFIRQKHCFLGEVVTELIKRDARSGERPMKSTLELKRHLEAQGVRLGKEQIPRVSAKDMEHIDDAMVEILLRADEERNYLEQIRKGNTPLSNAKECLMWFLSLAPPVVKPRPDPWDLLSIEDYPLPDLRPKQPKSLELVKSLSSENKDSSYASALALVSDRRNLKIKKIQQKSS